MDLKDASSLISDLVGEANEILGAHLASLIKQRQPDWDVHSFGCTSLSSFIAQHVRSVYVSGRSGMDYIYKKVPEGEASDAVATANFWRAWVSPYGRYVLAIDPSSGKVKALPRNASTPSGHLRLEPPTVQAHQELALEFLSQSGADPDGKIAALVLPDKPTWWQAWYAALRKAGLAPKWNAFRRNRMQQLLLQAIGVLPLEQKVKDLAFEEIRSADAIAIKHTAAKAIDPADSLVQARAVAIRAIEQMSEQELRELRLPFGVILDVMRTKG